jgi:peroxiredoxin
LRDDRERFERAGAAVVLIGLGTPEQTVAFCTGRGVPFACVTSPDREAHRSFGLRRGNLDQLAGPRVWLPWLRNQAAGLPQGRFGQGDVAQLAGTFVVDRSGTIRYSHRGRHSNDNPPNDDVLKALSEIAVGPQKD